MGGSRGNLLCPDTVSCLARSYGYTEVKLAWREKRYMRAFTHQNKPGCGGSQNEVRHLHRHFFDFSKSFLEARGNVLWRISKSESKILLSSTALSVFTCTSQLGRFPPLSTIPVLEKTSSTETSLRTMMYWRTSFGILDFILEMVTEPER